MSHLKLCCTCRQEKPEGSFSLGEWAKEKSRRCRPCIKQKNRSTHESNRDSHIEGFKKYYEENKQDIRERQKVYRDENPQVHRTCNSRYYYGNWDRIQQERKMNRELNGEQLTLDDWRRRLKRTYGLTVEDYYEMLENQENSCYICETTTPGRAGKGPERVFAVDHCHQTGKVRGLLCHSCNKGLGFFKDNPVLLQKAITYLSVLS